VRTTARLRAYRQPWPRATMSRMDNLGRKQHLPFPYNQDLSGVLSHLDRRTPLSRARLANDPVTVAYLAAGVRLIERHLGAGATRQLIDSEDESSIARPALDFVSQRAIAAEVGNNPDPFHRMGSVSTLRSTWKSHSDFIADLLSFGLWSEHYVMQYDSKVDIGGEDILDGPDLVQAVHSAAYADLATIIGMPMFRLELIAAATADGDEIVRHALAENHRGALEPWKQVYRQLLQARGLQLRPGIQLDELANLLAAMSGGLAVRLLADPTAPLIDHERQRTLLGKGALALLLACMEPAGTASGRTLEQAVHDLVYDR
jgi:hypothetical protein